MLLSEITTLVGDILAQFPNSKSLADGFIGAAANVLSQYPRQVVLKCADPRRGIAREIKFLSIADIVSWCEKETEPLRLQVAREKRVEAQLDAREEWQGETPSERLKEAGKAWLNRSDPIAQELSGTKNSAKIADDARNALIEQVGQDAFDAIPNAKRA